jgi:hypothetical protein
MSGERGIFRPLFVGTFSAHPKNAGGSHVSENVPIFSDRESAVIKLLQTATK